MSLLEKGSSVPSALGADGAPAIQHAVQTFQFYTNDGAGPHNHFVELDGVFGSNARALQQTYDEYVALDTTDWWNISNILLRMLKDQSFLKKKC